MKKTIITAMLLFGLNNQTKACAWYDPEYEYFNLFTQSIIKDKSYLPFLMALDSKFYTSNVHVHDENIEDWQKFFGNQLNYQDTEFLVKKVSYDDLQNFKQGQTNNAFLLKLGPNFYKKYSEAIDYLLEAKYIEPYMQVKYVENPNTYFYRESENSLDASDLNYAKISSDLKNLYNTANHPEIKLRYGYQLVRFNHYTLHFQEAIDSFHQYVEPFKRQSAPYFLALDQMAGAQRGLGNGTEANWNFFKVFSYSKSRKESAFTSMTLSDQTAFIKMLDRAKTPEEKNMVYFLHAYSEYNNPIPTMEKMYEIDPNSEILKVLAARSINFLERTYLVTDYSSYNPESITDTSTNTKNNTDSSDSSTEKITFWTKIINFFKNIFAGKEESTTDRSNNLSDKSYLNNPNRIPFFKEKESRWSDDKKVTNYIDEFDNFIDKTKDKSPDEFWKIASAYLKFLKKDYSKSIDILNNITTNNLEYQKEIAKMKVLNEIVSQPKIDDAFEEKLMTTYKNYFIETAPQKEITDEYEDYRPSTSEFITDILANRYFLQGDDAKSFLMNNTISQLQYNPDLELTKKLEIYIKKNNKSAFDQYILKNKIDIKGNPEAFFTLIYGDQEMRNGNFDKAKNYYTKLKGFGGLTSVLSYYDTEAPTKNVDNIIYDGFNNISPLVFGHNVWESFSSDDAETMRTETFASSFPSIQNKMNKLQLATALVELQKVGRSKGLKAADANQLIGNLLYNTSILGYYRHLFVLDQNNAGWSKYDFYKQKTPYQYYYKNYGYNSYIKPENFNTSIAYYQKALDQSTNNEQKARILFQMASAEQGQYYQWENQQSTNILYDDLQYEEKLKSYDDKLNMTKNEKYRKYFAQLKQHYANTATYKDLQSSCLYFKYYSSK